MRSLPKRLSRERLVELVWTVASERGVWDLRPTEEAMVAARRAALRRENDVARLRPERRWW